MTNGRMEMFWNQKQLLSTFHGWNKLNDAKNFKINQEKNVSSCETTPKLLVWYVFCLSEKVLPKVTLERNWILAVWSFWVLMISDTMWRNKSLKSMSQKPMVPFKPYPAKIDISKSTIETPKVQNVLQVNNKNTRTPSMTSFWIFYHNFFHCF